MQIQCKMYGKGLYNSVFMQLNEIFQAAVVLGHQEATLLLVLSNY